MRNYQENPKNGWKYANKDEMQKQASNMAAEYHCMFPEKIYEKFNSLDIYLPSILHFFLGNNLIHGNDILMQLFMSNKTDELFKTIGNNYKKLSEIDK